MPLAVATCDKMLQYLVLVLICTLFEERSSKIWGGVVSSCCLLQSVFSPFQCLFLLFFFLCVYCGTEVLAPVPKNSTESPESAPVLAVPSHTSHPCQVQLRAAQVRVLFIGWSTLRVPLNPSSFLHAWSICGIFHTCPPLCKLPLHIERGRGGGNNKRYREHHQPACVHCRMKASAREH